MNILILDDYQSAIKTLKCFELLKDAGHHISILGEIGLSTTELINSLKHADIIIPLRERTVFSKEVLEHLPNLKLISQTGKVSGHIDLITCERLGIEIREGKGLSIAPAELIWGLMIASRRQLVESVEDLKSGRWQTTFGQQLFGQTLGIWGYGKIGKQVSQYAKVFGMKVQIWGSDHSKAAAQVDGFCAAASRQEFFETSDIVTLTLRYSETTKHIVTRSDLVAMKPSALFINTSRAGLVEPGALLSAVESGRPGFAAVDVYEQEPLVNNVPLLNHPRILCTPHIGYVERDTYEVYFESAIQNALDFISSYSTSTPQEKASQMPELTLRS